MSDLIEREAAIEAFQTNGSVFAYGVDVCNAIISRIKMIPSAQSDIDEWCTDCSEYDHDKHCCPRFNRVIRTALEDAQPEPISDAYAKAVLTWLIDYQIKAAKLKGRYTPYEVLSWVASDWRKEEVEHEYISG